MKPSWKWSSHKRMAVMRYNGSVLDLRTLNDVEVQQWLAEGNEPDPPDPPPSPESIEPTFSERLQAAETLINLILDEEGE